MRRVTIVLFAGAACILVQPALGKPPAPSNVSIAATANPIVFGSSTTITGQISGGKKAAAATVELQSQPFPYSAPFSTVARATADATGHYSFSVSPRLNTLYRVLAKTAPTATSSNLLVKVRVKVRLRVSTTTPVAGQLVRFSGFVLPAYNGRFIQIQRKTSTGWKTVGRARLRAAVALGTATRSKYGKRLRIRHSGTYRVRFNPADGARLANTSSERSLTVR
jgi:hypothetical protein